MVYIFALFLNNDIRFGAIHFSWFFSMNFFTRGHRNWKFYNEKWNCGKIEQPSLISQALPHVITGGALSFKCQETISIWTPSQISRVNGDCKNASCKKTKNLYGIWWVTVQCIQVYTKTHKSYNARNRKKLWCVTQANALRGNFSGAIIRWYKSKIPSTSKHSHQIVINRSTRKSSFTIVVDITHFLFNMKVRKSEISNTLNLKKKGSSLGQNV